MTFEELDFVSHLSGEGVMAKAFFKNGYGASVICTPFSYGGPSDFYELAVLKGDPINWDLCYSTDITDDVIGWLTPNEVTNFLQRIEAL
jgi:hypothetical protein